MFSLRAGKRDHAAIKERAMKKIVSVLVLGLAATLAQADDQHMVDMADGLGAHQFYQAQNPDSLWSSDLAMPWAKQSAVNAYEDEKTTGELVTQVVNPQTSKTYEGGNRYAPGKLINVRQAFDPRAKVYVGSSSWASQALYADMAENCPAGFQRIAEWAEPIAEGGFYLYFQFSCIAPKAQK